MTFEQHNGLKVKTRCLMLTTSGSDRREGVAFQQDVTNRSSLPSVW